MTCYIDTYVLNAMFYLLFKYMSCNCNEALLVPPL